MKPVATTAAAFGVAQLADIIAWLCDWPIKAPPANVANGLAALLMAGAHWGALFVSQITSKSAAPAAPAQE